MSCQKTRWIPTVLCAAVVLASGVALAEYDTFYLGTGRDGALTVSSTGSVVNHYAQVVAPLATGDTSIAVAAEATGGFQAGDLIMVLQTTGIVPEPVSGESSVRSLRFEAVARWEFARLTSVESGQAETMITLSAPLVHSYAALVSQVIRVPEYTSVEIDTGGAIEASAWNGATGGVIAFLVQGTLTNNGKIDASGAGFRGGQAATDTTGSYGCEEMDEAAPRGAQKGEGFASTRYGAAHTGRGNVGNGAGGGNCIQSGGGGGGNGGKGGRGGYVNLTVEGYLREGMGLPGSAYGVFPVEDLALGGGGGAGHGVNGLAGSGSRGGGAILIRANALAGTGVIQANGLIGGTASQAPGDGGGGGGAGGTISLRFAGMASCGGIKAEGGEGGGTVGSGGATYLGPGGGGGGGVVLLQSTGGTCDISVTGGLPGWKNTSNAGWEYGAAMGQPGITEVHNTAFAHPSPPTIETPVNNAFVKPNRPWVSGKAGSGETVAVFIDGVERGRAVANSSGVYSVTPEAVPDGAHSVEVAAMLLGVWSSKSPAISITLDSVAPAAPVISAPVSDSWLADTTPTISGTAEPGSMVRLHLDTTTWGEVTADAVGYWSFTPPTPLAERSSLYQLSAIAFDLAGNNSVPSSPYVKFGVDVTVPETSISSAPTSPSNSISTTFEFSSLEGLVSFECRLDDAVAFEPCTSPLVLTLTDGSHEFQVRARDRADNVDPTPAVHSWIIDTGAPDVSIVSGPAPRTNGTSATFVLASNDRGASFECLLDDATAFEPCSASVSFTDLLDGEHSLQVKALDVVGNVSPAPATWTWTVDTVAPDVPIVTVPTEGQVLGGSSQVFSGTAEAGSQVRVFVDGTEVGTATADDAGAWSVTSSTALEGGTHSVKAMAIDAAGNTSGESVERTFEVDATPPETTIVSKPEAQTESTSATFDFESEAGAIFECSLDGADFEACPDPVTFSNLSSGPHELRVRAKDAAGNVDPTPESYSWKINDPVEPEPAQGCGCSSPAGDPSLAMMLLAGLGVLVSRRRRR